MSECMYDSDHEAEDNQIDESAEVVNDDVERVVDLVEPSEPKFIPPELYKD